MSKLNHKPVLHRIVQQAIDDGHTLEDAKRIFALRNAARICRTDECFWAALDEIAEMNRSLFGLDGGELI